MKKDYRKKAHKRRKKKKKQQHNGCEQYKNLPKDLMSIEKNIIKWEKTSYYNYKKYF